MTDAAKPARGLGGLAVYGERRVFVMLLLGFASGLPNLLIFDTLSAWLRDASVSLEVIAFFGLATLTYALKFVWAPLLDRTNIPVLTKWLGHRRSWMLATQAMLILGLWLISGSNPQNALGMVALFAVIVGFFGATQDIAIDAWRIEAADDSRQGAMAAAYQLGWRVAQITAGALPLILAELYNWNLSYAVMAALMGFGVLGVLLAPREQQHVVRPIPVGDVPSRPAVEVVEWIVRLGLIAVAALIIGTGLTDQPDALLWAFGGALDEGARAAVTAGLENGEASGVAIQFAYVIGGFLLLTAACWPIPGFRTRPGAYLAGSFGEPLKDFFVRFGRLALPILALICLYRLSDFVLNIMNPFYLDMGFSKIEVAEVRKVFGVVATSGGVFVGGWMVMRLGLIRTMVIGAFMSPVSNLVFAWLATQGHDVQALFVAISVDNVATGIAGTALIAYMSSLTSIGFTATQYALFSSLYALPGKIIASQSGKIVEASARSADAGGLPAAFKGLFAGMPEGSLVEGAAKSGTTVQGLGAGYFTFFLYSTVIGVFAILLAFYVARRQPGVVAEAAARVKAEKTEVQPS
ncbi:MAG: MFS transporter [Alphaproteobacteria bacterium]|nr:MFS transporter [Alphaproteobacteria bacterium]MBU1525024.1 MFS transporter [Alphaproteobacteria bacterium]MBU2117611.1 MFS transporter [Alphaproteobacteria bacterium]MBU2349897.1 MFS transporter [Alphaproteobacteria bacterium]MBU2382612.1 MFS transporter [Alphaproteobacteria bacterium]